tara:strand:+ start:3765 stop:4601 length:837 start_codon:yes stop_codon:yes gene_type:complete
MHIITKLKDYYDGVLTHGVDPNICYVRHTQELSIDMLRNVCSTFTKREHTLLEKMNTCIKDSTYNDRRLEPCILAFCGKIYPVYRWYEYFTRPNHVLKIVNRALDKNLLHKEKCKQIRKSYLNPNVKSTSRQRRQIYNYNYKLFTKEWFKSFVKEYGTGIDVPYDVFFKLNVPVFLIRKKDYYSRDVIIVTNPCLKDLKFQSVLDPYTAYQELAMFIGGVLPQATTEMIEIANDIMRDKKGFDEWSFKNIAPGQKKARRKLNKQRKRIFYKENKDYNL